MPLSSSPHIILPEAMWWQTVQAQVHTRVLNINQVNAPVGPEQQSNTLFTDSYMHLPLSNRNKTMYHIAGQAASTITSLQYATCTT